MKYFKSSLLLLMLVASSCGKAQVVVQTWVDPCTNTVQTATFPINGPGVMIMYRGQSKIFTAQQAQAIVDGEVAKAQAAYDALPAEQKTNLNRQRPTAINLP